MHHFLLAALFSALFILPISALAAPPSPSEQAQQLRAYSVITSVKQAQQMRRQQFDITSMSVESDKQIKMEVIMTPAQAQLLEAQGVRATLKQGRARNPGANARSLSEPIFRPYGGSGGLAEEIYSLAERYPTLTQLEVIGQSTLGADILALKVGKKRKRFKFSREGLLAKKKARPSVIYVSTQHAREWITPEVNRRLLRYFLEKYDSDPLIKNVVDTTDLWFVLVANPDGYDYSFTEGNRLWRKSLTDNDGDGQITVTDGVDLNRNFSSFWGLNNEGSSPEPRSGAYRGAGPNSEPETLAFDRFVRKIRPQFLINYHSAIEILLYGVGYQVSAPSPDDIIAAALAGDDANPAIPGFDPDPIFELTNANGDTNAHVGFQYGTIAFTPELTRCQTVAADPAS